MATTATNGGRDCSVRRPNGQRWDYARPSSRNGAVVRGDGVLPLADGPVACGRASWGRPKKCACPRELEWERAARGTDGLEYPWGNDYEPGRANIDETSDNAGPHFLRQTSAVGIYPQGASSSTVRRTRHGGQRVGVVLQQIRREGRCGRCVAGAARQLLD